MLPNLNPAASAWLGHNNRDEEASSSLHPIDSSASSPSPILSHFDPSHARHYFMSSNPGFNLSFELPVSAAQSRVGSPTEPAPVADHPNSGSAEQMTLFQRRFALGKSLGSSADGMVSLSFDGSGFNYDSGELMRQTVVKVEEDENGGINGGVVPMMKKKKKGAPAKNLMAERRRRKKLNEKLLMLRSAVPKISKMDRVSILRDAIQYLEELTQKINLLENELDPVQSPASSQSTSPAISSVTYATSFAPNFPARMKPLYPISLPSPNGQPARIEVRAKGRAMSIHMFCSKRPGLLLSVTRALESIGLEIQKAVFSGFNGFLLDIYRAEQCQEGQYVYPEQIKALLLEAVGFTAA